MLEKTFCQLLLKAGSGWGLTLLFVLFTFLFSRKFILKISRGTCIFRSTRWSLRNQRKAFRKGCSSMAGCKATPLLMALHMIYSASATSWSIGCSAMEDHRQGIIAEGFVCFVWFFLLFFLTQMQLVNHRGSFSPRGKIDEKALWKYMEKSLSPRFSPPKPLEIAGKQTWFSHPRLCLCFMAVPWCKA